MPATPADAKGLIKSAIRDNDPVIFVEHRGLYGSRGQVPEGEVTVAFGKASIVREGNDVTIIAMAKTLATALEAADELAADGVSVEVIDPRSLLPLDMATIVN